MSVLTEDEKSWLENYKAALDISEQNPDWDVAFCANRYSTWFYAEHVSGKVTLTRGNPVDLNRILGSIEVKI